MTHKDKLLSLVLNLLYGVDHTDILTHLESGFCIVKLKILEAHLAQALKELKGVVHAYLSHVHAVLVLVQGQRLQKVSQMAFVIVSRATPVVDVRVGLQVLPTDSIATSVRVDKSTLQDEWLEVTINKGHNSWLVLVNLFKLEILW